MRARRDEGVVTAFVVIFATALLFVTGLVLDGGRILTTKRQDRNIAQSAARAGAQVLDDQSVRAGHPTLDPAGAQGAACNLLAQAGHACGGGSSVQVQGNQVIVTITDTVNLVMIPGVAPQTFTVEGRACNAQGITGNETTAHC